MLKIEFETIKEQINTSGILKALSGYEYPLIVSGITENLCDNFRMHRFSEYAIFQDYWVDTLISLGEEHSDFNFLQADECVTA